jgi:hypothetical protein
MFGLGGLRRYNNNDLLDQETTTTFSIEKQQEPSQ